MIVAGVVVVAVGETKAVRLAVVVVLRFPPTSVIVGAVALARLETGAPDHVWER